MTTRPRFPAALVAAAIIAAACGGDSPLANSDASMDGGPRLLASALSGATTYPGDRVQTTDKANVRAMPTVTSTLVGVQPLGALGTVVAGPVVDVTGERLTRWQVDFDTGPDGWVADLYLNQISGAPIGSIALAPAPLTLALGDTVRLTATVLSPTGTVMTGTALAWTSSNATAITVSSSGLVTGAASGTATVTASSRGKSGSSAVTVNKFKLGGRVHPSGGANVRSAPAGSASLLGAQPDSVSGVIIGGPVVDLTGDKYTRWQVDFDTGPDGWVAEQYLVTSTAALPPAPPASVSLTPDTANIVVGKTVQLTAVAKDAAGTTLPNVTMSWLSLDTTKAKVAATGLVTGVAAGTALIVASTANKADTSRITVMPVPVASVAVSPATASILAGATVQLAAAAKDSAGGVLAGRPIAWTTSNAAVATISASGLVTGVAAGAVSITASSGGKSGAAAVTVTVPAPVVSGFFVSPTGTSGGDGSQARPWDLRTALSGAVGRVGAGDTVWLRGGTYRGSFRATVSGSAGRPVVFRQYPGERATIDGAGTPSTTSVFWVGGAYTAFWGFEITNTDPVRTTMSLANNVRPNVVSNYANHTRYINLVVHDGGVAFYNETDYSDVDIAGCIIYNNGWDAPNRGHGHGLYLKSTVGPVVARDNVIFNQFGYGVHVYTNAGSGLLTNIQLEGNVAFNNGSLSTVAPSSNMLLGGDGRATGDVLRDNMTYFSAGTNEINVKIGYGALVNGDVQVTGNYFVGGAPVLDMGYWSAATLTGNTFIGSANMITLNDRSSAAQAWSLNTHQRDPLAIAWKYAGTTYNFATWKATSSVGLADVVLPGTPLLSRIVVRRNPYETGRANVVVYNWSGAGSAVADLSGILLPGERYEVHNVQDLFGAAVASGTYNGPIAIPMDGVTPPAPVGFATSRAPRTGPNFDVFVVTKI